jgi:hypothetical protein
MIYTPPNGNDIGFVLISYSPPSGDLLLFDLTEQKPGDIRPVFYAADISFAAFTMSLTENASYPLSNLHTNIPTLLWKSSANTNNQTLNIDLGSARACDFLGIGSQNWLFMTSVKFQCATTDDGNFTDPLTILNLNGSPDLPNIIPFESKTKRYWRILFENCNNIIPQLGLFYISKSMVFPFPYNMDAELGNKQFSTTVKISPDGTLRTTRQIAGRERMEVSFTLIDDVTAAAWQTMMDAVQGRLNPFFFKDDNEKLHLVHFEEDYIPVKGKRANVNDLVRLKMCHQTTG